MESYNETPTHDTHLRQLGDGYPSNFSEKFQTSISSGIFAAVLVYTRHGLLYFPANRCEYCNYLCQRPSLHKRRPQNTVSCFTTWRALTFRSISLSTFKSSLVTLCAHPATGHFALPLSILRC